VTPDTPLSREEFVEHLADGLDLDSAAFTDTTRFDLDLGLDSFDLVELLVLVEELGVRFPEHVVLQLETVGDLYRAYQTRASRRVSD
jgi:acyl carrier protein